VVALPDFNEKRTVRMHVVVSLNNLHFIWVNAPRCSAVVIQARIYKKCFFAYLRRFPSLFHGCDKA